jgi:hypothetical protein
MGQFYLRSKVISPFITVIFFSSLCCAFAFAFHEAHPVSFDDALSGSDYYTGNELMDDPSASYDEKNEDDQFSKVDDVSIANDDQISADDDQISIEYAGGNQIAAEDTATGDYSRRSNSYSYYYGYEDDAYYYSWCYSYGEKSGESWDDKSMTYTGSYNYINQEVPYTITSPTAIVSRIKNGIRGYQVSTIFIFLFFVIIGSGLVIRGFSMARNGQKPDGHIYSRMPMYDNEFQSNSDNSPAPWLDLPEPDLDHQEQLNSRL